VTTTYRIAPGALCEMLDDKAAIVNPDGTELITLNQVGSIIWQTLAAHPGSDIHRLVEAVQELGGAPGHDAVELDAREFLDRLVLRGLVVADTGGPAPQ